MPSCISLMNPPPAASASPASSPIASMSVPCTTYSSQQIADLLHAIPPQRPMQHITSMLLPPGDTAARAATAGHRRSVPTRGSGTAQHAFRRALALSAVFAAEELTMHQCPHNPRRRTSPGRAYVPLGFGHAWGAGALLASARTVNL